MQMKIKYWIPILLIIAIFSFIGCKTTTIATIAASEITVPETTQPAEAIEPESSIPETTATVEGKKYSATRETNLSNGYSYSETFTVWEPITDSGTDSVQHPLDSSFTPDNYNQKKDLAIPMQVHILNKTANFDLENILTWVFLSMNGDASDEVSAYVEPSKLIDIIANYSDGTSISNYLLFVNNGFVSMSKGNDIHINVQWSAIPPNQISYLNCFIVIKDYYTPAYPEGNAKLLDLLAIGTTMSPLDGRTDPFITLSGTDLLAKE